ncbi:hypothetical protein [Mycobacterium sp.]|uniref:DUF7064 domain-containing protein n=1 Tax=Mycobacterium sp. TaxID=1785 RepID=UPI0012266C38|nr:hypothetical protein [Mycobacterium sp.]TAM64428.1 MAG: hypothetical protein EPN51_23315 [Mycobacterium sp.]
MPLQIDPAELPAAELSGGWTENFCNQCFSPNSRAGLWFHLSRLAGPWPVWRDILIAYLPGGRFLIAKGFGEGAHERGPGAGMLSLTCHEAWTHWTMRFSGAVRDVRGDELRAGALRDQAHHLARIEMTWTAMAPVWDLGEEMKTQTWTQSHYEQACRTTGTITIGDERFDLTGTGIRDHSRGPRDFGTVHDHWWLSGQFPSGRSFAVLEVTGHSSDSHLLRRSYISDGSASIREVEVVTLESELGPHGPISHRTVLRDGAVTQTITGQIRQTMPFGMGQPNELIFGHTLKPPTTLRLWEAQTEFTWDGETGFGLTERSLTKDIDV